MEFGVLRPWKVQENTVEISIQTLLQTVHPEANVSSWSLMPVYPSVPYKLYLFLSLYFMAIFHVNLG